MMRAHEDVSDERAADAEADDASDDLLALLAALGDERMLGRYELLTPIGMGGMAVVWAARLSGMRGFSKIFAVKTMLPALSTSPRLQRMFLAEARIASRIKHPNVCEVLDVGEERGALYLVQEWVDGDPLSTLVSEGARRGERHVPYGIAAKIVAKAARGLHAAHVLQKDDGELYGVVHRDVSPQNILLTCEGDVKIVDFGVAKVAERSDRVTRSGFIKGKVAYLAPEQVHKHDVDARADIFALGTVLFELASGAHPFRRETELATLLEIGAREPVRPSLPGSPRTLEAILARALERSPQDRYPSMRELAHDLEELAIAEGVDDAALEVFARGRLGELRAARAASLRAAAVQADVRRARANERLEGAAEVESAPPRWTSRWALAAAGALGIAGAAIAVRAATLQRSADARASEAPAAIASGAVARAPSAAPSGVGLVSAAPGPAGLGSAPSEGATARGAPAAPGTGGPAAPPAAPRVAAAAPSTTPAPPSTLAREVGSAPAPGAPDTASPPRPPSSRGAGSPPPPIFRNPDF